MTTDPISEIKPGLTVFTRDGEHIGAIKEVADSVFKVDAPMHPDFWLRRDEVLSFTAEHATMDFTNDELEAHRADE